MKEIEAELNINTATELYQYFKSQQNETIDYKICKDLKRTVIGNMEFNLDHKSGKNKLYNILNAYAHYDRETTYCQGMNFIVALLLNHLPNEEDTFYCFVHIMEVHRWKECFDMHTTKLVNLLEFLECVLETGWPQVFQHIMNEIEISLVPLFSSIIQTIFIYDSPEPVATHIFDVFLMDGETVIFTLLLKMIELKEEKILNTFDHDLLTYIRLDMSKECMSQKSMATLMD